MSPEELDEAQWHEGLEANERRWQREVEDKSDCASLLRRITDPQWWAHGGLPYVAIGDYAEGHVMCYACYHAPGGHFTDCWWDEAILATREAPGDTDR